MTREQFDAVYKYLAACDAQSDLILSAQDGRKHSWLWPMVKELNLLKQKRLAVLKTLGEKS